LSLFRIKNEILRPRNRPQDDKKGCHPERSDRAESPEGRDLGLEAVQNQNWSLLAALVRDDRV